MYKLVKNTAFNKSSFNFSKFQYRKVTMTNSEHNLILKKGLTKRNFSYQNFGFGLSPVIKLVLGANAFIYFMGFSMDRNQFARSFLYNKTSALTSGKSYTIITCHFAKLNLFEFVFESLIIALIGSNIAMTSGDLVLRKLIGFSVVLSGLFIILGTKDDTVFYKSDAIIRGILMYLVASSPNSSFMMFPLPIQIKALYLGIVMVGLDLFTNKIYNFGGTFTAIALTMGVI